MHAIKCAPLVISSPVGILFTRVSHIFLFLPVILSIYPCLQRWSHMYQRWGKRVFPAHYKIYLILSINLQTGSVKKFRVNSDVRTYVLKMGYKIVKIALNAAIFPFRPHCDNAPFLALLFKRCAQY